MKKTLSLLLSLFLFAPYIVAQDTPGSVKFPGSVDTADSLIRATNSARSTLSASITSSATMITVVSTASFPSSGAAMIDNEIVFYTAKTSTTLTGVTRGADSTTAATHSSGAAVRGVITAAHHNTLASAIIATQNRLLNLESDDLPTTISGKTLPSATLPSPTVSGGTFNGGTFNGVTCIGCTNLGTPASAGTASTGDVTFASGTDGSGDTIIQAGGTERARFTADGKVTLGGQRVRLPFNVETYGATGDGTADDTSAFSSAIAACNSAGGGIIYAPRPSSFYKITAALTTITAPCTVRGDGSGSSPSAVQWATKIVMTSRTATLFTVTADSATFEHVYLFNSNSTYGVGGAAPATPPTAGAGVQVTASSSSQKVNLDDVVIEGFYDNVRQDGSHWVLSRSHIINPVHLGLYATNTIAADAGDWAISDTQFISKTYLATAHLQIQDGGGGKLSNVKFNAYDDPAIPGVTGFTTGISATYTATSILSLSNVSIENYDAYAMNLTSVSLLSLSNVQIGDYTSGGTHPGILLTSCTDVNLTSVLLRSTVAPTQVGIQCDSCTRVTPVSLTNDGFLGPLQFTTAYTTAYTALTPATGWANTGAPFAPVGYWFNAGHVCVRGMVTYSSGGTTTIATLPAHLRPSYDKVFAAVESGAFQRIRIIASTGVIQQEGGPSVGVQSLDGVCYDLQ